MYNPLLHECRCTAGWGGRFCEVREKRPCNTNTDGSPTNADSLCAGNCDDNRGHCYCAGLATPYERPLPHYCAPWAHRDTKLPDGRPAYPVLNPRSGQWEMARLHYERPTKERPWLGAWARYYLKPFDAVYGAGTDVPAIPNRRGWPKVTPPKAGWCERNASVAGRPLALSCNGCYEGRTGRFCDRPKRSYCLRDCTGHGTCDSGFCWCDKGWFGVDCGERIVGPAGAPRAATPGNAARRNGTERAPTLQSEQHLPSRANGSPLRVYVYDMPAEFTTRMLQYRPSVTQGLHRMYTGDNRSQFHPGSLYAMESALHEWLLDSELRTTDGEQAHLYFVPVYAASIFMWPVSKFADEPYYGRRHHENRRRSHQGALFLKRALTYVRKYYPYWGRSHGADHIFMMLHDEGPCFAPRELRSAILLTHYGYWSAHPRPWGTYYDDNFMQDPRFYARHLGDPKRPTPCFARGRDLVIAPWKTPGFWTGAFQKVTPRAERQRPRKGLVFFAGDLGLNRLPGYSHDLRQRAYAMFCDPRTTRTRDCTPYVYGCRKEFALNCSRWEPGVSIRLHSRAYHQELMDHTFCLAFPGDGWSSRVLDAVVHGCIPVIIQDESEMFFEGAFAAAGLPIDYDDFSIRLLEAELPDLVTRLKAVPPERIARMRRVVVRAPPRPPRRRAAARAVAPIAMPQTTHLARASPPASTHTLPYVPCADVGARLLRVQGHVQPERAGARGAHSGGSPGAGRLPAPRARPRGARARARQAAGIRRILVEAAQPQAARRDGSRGRSRPGQAPPRGAHAGILTFAFRDAPLTPGVGASGEILASACCALVGLGACVGGWSANDGTLSPRS